MRLRPAGGELCRAWHPGGRLPTGHRRRGGVDVAGALPPSFKPGAPLGAQYSPRELARYQDNPLIPQGVSSELMNKRFGLTREAWMPSPCAAISEPRGLAGVKDQLVHLTEDPADPTARSSPPTRACAPTPPREDGHAESRVCRQRRHGGNFSQISDGAAALLIASRAYAKQHGLKPRARFVSTAVAAADPVIQFTAVLDPPARR
jgi:acetyl-CoA C-acetyltransferase